MAAGPGSSANAGRISVELNRADPFESGCRLSFVIRNDTPHSFTALQWDLVGFDPEGLIADRMAANVAPLPAHKTSVKQFDVTSLSCERLGKLLLNDITRCEADGDHKDAWDPFDCLELITASSRTEIELFK